MAFEKKSRLPALKDPSPIRLLIITSLCSFLAEVLASALFFRFNPASRSLEILYDALLSTILILPLLYVFMFRPLIEQMGERKRAEDSLQKAHDQLEMRVRERTEELARANRILRLFELLSDNSRDAILYMQRDDGRILEANAAALRAYGYTLEEMRTLTIHDLRAPDTRGLTAGQMTRADHEGILFETIHQRRDGSTFPVEVSSQGATIDDRRTLISVIRDITQRKQAEQALQDSQRRMSVILDSIADGFYALDREWRFIHLNDAAVRYFGKSCEEMVGRSVFDIFPATIGSVFEDGYRRALQSNEPVHLEAPSVATDRIVEIHAYPSQENLTVLFRDVTERYTMQAALRQSEERYRSLFNTMTEGFAIHEVIADDTGQPVDYRFLDINPAFERLTGLIREDVIGRTYNTVLPGNDLRWVQTCGEVALTGRPVHFEEYSSALKKHFEVHAYRPAPNQFATIFMDISQRKEAEEALRKAFDELEARVQERTLDLSKAIQELHAEIAERKRVEGQLLILTTALEAAANGVFITDAEGKVEWSNPSFSEMTGYNRESIQGQTPRFLRSGKQSPGFYQNMWDTIRSGQVWHAELVNKRRDGSLYYGDQTITPVLDENRKVIHYIAIQRDVTERVEAEAKIRDRNEKLEALYQAELRARKTAETLRSASLALTETLNLHSVTNTLLDYIARLVPFDSASVILFDQNNHLAVWATRGYEHLADPAQALAEYFQPQSNPAIQELIANRRTISIPETTQEAGRAPLKMLEKTRSWLGVPLVAAGRLIGLCELNKAEAGFFTPEYIQWAEALAGQSAVVIQNSWLFEQVRGGRERLQSLSHRLVEIQENERRYIARELHDEAGQMLTSLIIGLGLLEREANNPQAVVAGIAELNRLVDDVLEDLHRLAIDLRPASLDHLGLVAALHQHIESLSEKHHLMFNFQTLGLNERLPLEIETTLYRVVQEALTNVVRHAQASRVDILIELRSDHVVAIIEDNGAGFDPASQTQPDRLGLFGMRERVEMLNGSFSIESSPGNGTTLYAEVPYVHPDPGRG